MEDDQHLADESNQVHVVLVLVGDEDDGYTAVDLVETQRLQNHCHEVQHQHPQRLPTPQRAKSQHHQSHKVSGSQLQHLQGHLSGSGGCAFAVLAGFEGLQVELEQQVGYYYYNGRGVPAGRVLQLEDLLDGERPDEGHLVQHDEDGEGEAGGVGGEEQVVVAVVLDLVGLLPLLREVVLPAVADRLVGALEARDRLLEDLHQLGALHQLQHRALRSVQQPLRVFLLLLHRRRLYRGRRAQPRLLGRAAADGLALRTVHPISI